MANGPAVFHIGIYVHVHKCVVVYAAIYIMVWRIRVSSIFKSVFSIHGGYEKAHIMYYSFFANKVIILNTTILIHIYYMAQSVGLIILLKSKNSGLNYKEGKKNNTI